MIRQEEDGLWLELTETIRAHHEEIFGALSTATGLTQWYPVAAKVDARPGGTIVFGWDGEFSRKTTVAVLEYDAGGTITWDWHPGVADMHAPIYWSVEPSVEDGCKVTFRQGPFRDDRDALLTLGNEASTWRWHMCNMRSVFEARHDMRKVRPI
ncbi:MAG: SRPBCC domain-containing protein [Planctomycetota bacterium]